jgi:putative transposase
MQGALEALVGPDAKGLSASVANRLKRRWHEYDDWCRRRFDDERWVYLWVDGIYSGLRAEGEKRCALVVIGVNEQGEKHFLAIEDGVRESTQSWREVLLDLKQRGLETAPELAIGDGALGFWAALDEVYPKTRLQRRWAHRTTNMLNHHLPESARAC